MAKEKPIQSTGIGESKMFVAPADDPMREEQPVRTVNGVPIPPELMHAIPYENTDQGIEERASKPKAYTEVVSDSFDKLVMERRDAQLASSPTWAAPDPMKELAEAYVKPGMSPKFLSPSKCTREGTRGFQVVRDEKGDPVKLGNMVLGQMPVENVEKRRKHFQEQGKRAQQQVAEEFQEQHAQLLSATGTRPSALRQSPDGDVGLQSERGNSPF